MNIDLEMEYLKRISNELNSLNTELEDFQERVDFMRDVSRNQMQMLVNHGRCEEIVLCA